MGTTRRQVPSTALALRLAALGLIAASCAAWLGGEARGAVDPSRPEYVAQLERICEPGSDATARAVHGVRPDVRSERLTRAAMKFSRAKHIFVHTVRTISTVRRPAADEAVLARWFAALKREETYLGRIVVALRTSNVARFQRASARFIHQGNRANNVVVSFGFNFCAFRPSRFQ
jgi:hypothetical protein